MGLYCHSVLVLPLDICHLPLPLQLPLPATATTYSNHILVRHCKTQHTRIVSSLPSHRICQLCSSPYHLAGVAGECGACGAKYAKYGRCSSTGLLFSAVIQSMVLLPIILMRQWGGRLG